MARVALVTGAAVRVGRAIAEGLAEAGYNVWVHCHSSRTEAERLVGDTPNLLGPLAADLTRERERERLVEEVLAEGGLDVLVNSAASFEHGDFFARSDADLRCVLELNLVAPLALARAFAPALAQRDGAVVNILDQGAHHPWGGQLDHCVSKAALAMATRALAVELAPTRVNAVSPGAVLPVGGGPAPSGAASPQDVAAAVVFLAGAAHVSGQCLAVDGGRLARLAGKHPAFD